MTIGFPLRRFAWLLPAAGLALAVGTFELGPPAGAADNLADQKAIERGKGYYTSCAGCHAPQGEGYPEMSGPGLAGLSAEYIAKQLRLYRTGERGSAGDAFGGLMTNRATALPGDVALSDVSAYIASLPPRPNGRPAASGEHPGVETCTACHAESARASAGNEAPPLSNLGTAYIERQLRNYRSGVRGSGRNDSSGQQMQTIAKSLPEDQLREISEQAGAIR